jgi:hypothetical protein
MTRELKKGMVVRAPWREFGDDKNLTGLIVSVSKKGIRVIWNADGDVTQAGDESLFVGSEQIERLEVVD